MYVFYFHSRLTYLPTRNWLAILNKENSINLQLVFNYPNNLIEIYRNSKKIGETNHTFPISIKATLYLRIRCKPDQIDITLDRTKIVLHQPSFIVGKFATSYWLSVTAFQEYNHIPINVEVCDSLARIDQLSVENDTFSLDSDSDSDSTQTAMIRKPLGR